MMAIYGRKMLFWFNSLRIYMFYISHELCFDYPPTYLVTTDHVYTVFVKCLRKVGIKWDSMSAVYTLQETLMIQFEANWCSLL